MILAWEGKLNSTRTEPVEWPDLTVDQRAWDLAKTLCGPEAIFSEVAAKAQWLKGVLLTAKPKGEL